MQKILIVDDVKTDRELIGKVVAQAGHTPIYANDGNEAIESAKRELPALIFMDVVMPNRDGFSATRTLKNDPATSTIPVVMVTSKNGESDRFWARKQGAMDHLGKPFTPDAVMEVIRRYAR